MSVPALTVTVAVVLLLKVSMPASVSAPRPFLLNAKTGASKKRLAAPLAVAAAERVTVLPAIDAMVVPAATPTP